MDGSPFIAVTDTRWFRYLRQRAGEGGQLDEVNFWNPSGRPMKHMAPGTPVFFKLKRPQYALGGYGFFATFIQLEIGDAWEYFGQKNGANDYYELLELIRRNRHEKGGAAPPRIGCTVLRDAVFWPDERHLPWSENQGFHRHVMVGRTEDDASRKTLLLATIAADEAEPPPDLSVGGFLPLDVDEREMRLAQLRPRVGQGTFRARLLSAYGQRCAITGEHTQPVLDAAHIQPYLGVRSNHVQNGLLLTKEFHVLFDRGYVTVTPDHEVRVSSALYEGWKNGHRYRPYDRKRLVQLPQRMQDWPSPEALAWHAEHCFLGT